MKSINFLFVIGLFAMFSLTSCESVEDAQIVADQFYEAFNTQNETVMESLLDQEAVIDAGIKDEFYKVFDQHWQAFGKVTTHDRYAFSTNSNNGITTVLLKFNCETEKGTKVYEKIQFVKRGEAYKIIQYEYNLDKAVIDKE